MTRRARRFMERPIMSVITVKRPLRKGTLDTMVNMTDRGKYRRSLVLRSFRQLSRSYFASEKSCEFVIEALLFAIIVAISAWPVFAAADRRAISGFSLSAHESGSEGYHSDTWRTDYGSYDQTLPSGLCLLKRDPTRSQSGDAPVIFGNFVPRFP